MSFGYGKHLPCGLASQTLACESLTSIVSLLATVEKRAEERNFSLLIPDISIGGPNPRGVIDGGCHFVDFFRHHQGENRSYGR